MTEKKQEGLRHRLERVWAKRRPNPDEQSEFTAEGQKARTPSRDEFFGNLERAAEDEPRAGVPTHSRDKHNGDVS